MAPSDVRAGTIIAGSYEITETLGRGGMGTVYAARHVRTGRRVAVKLLHGDARALPDAIERFRREARAAGTINSVHVTRVHDVEEDPQLGIAIIFELLKGKSLLDHLRASGVMSFEAAVPFVREALTGLDDAHRAGIIHRDLKPSNVFLERLPNGTTRVKLLDFGVSKLPKAIGGTTLTQPDQALGSFLFMPPEQVSKAADVDARADIYAFGVLLFQAMSGYLPFVGNTPIDVIHQKRVGEPRTLAEATGKYFPPQLEAWLRRCFEREPMHRFSSAREALYAWEQVVASVMPSMPVIAVPDVVARGIPSPSAMPAGLAPLPMRSSPVSLPEAARSGGYAALPPPARASGPVLPSVPTMAAAPVAFPSGLTAQPGPPPAAPSVGPPSMPVSSRRDLPVSSRSGAASSRGSTLKVALIAASITFVVASIGLAIVWAILRTR